MPQIRDKVGASPSTTMMRCRPSAIGRRYMTTPVSAQCRVSLYHRLRNRHFPDRSQPYFSPILWFSPHSVGLDPYLSSVKQPKVDHSEEPRARAVATGERLRNGATCLRPENHALLGSHRA